MIRYSLLDIPKVPDDIQVENITIRLEEGKFDKTVITFDPIKLSEDGTQIQYGVIVRALIFNDKFIGVNANEPKLKDVLHDNDVQLLDNQLHEVFADVLLLMKDNIQYK